jgi:hypothetical protein
MEVRHAGAKIVLEIQEVGQSLVDLNEKIGTRTIHVFIAQFDNHLS